MVQPDHPCRYSQTVSGLLFFRRPTEAAVLACGMYVNGRISEVQLLLVEQCPRTRMYPGSDCTATLQPVSLHT